MLSLCTLRLQNATPYFMYWSLLPGKCKNVFHEHENYRHQGCKSVYVCLLNTVMY